MDYQNVEYQNFKDDLKKKMKHFSVNSNKTLKTENIQFCLRLCVTCQLFQKNTRKINFCLKYFFKDQTL